ncbi:hypothetical protein Ahy_A07g033293 [Arachis hypogaea]|uniref:SWIM-type domain-containing protein n=1 Tax=Arachis hypogaea TaxID=3818 RepID=A0A445C8V6_ARAHY|nr:hypothetical protein Ahy_A07g033293 [Arachis hypogaea]
MWYKDPSSEWLEKDLKLFAGDIDALEMCRIAELRSHVELFVVHKIEDAEEFSAVSEEEYDDESGFEDLIGATDGDRVDKDKGVVNSDFSDEEGFNSDELDLDYEVGGGSDKEDRQDDDNDEATLYPTHKDVKDMTSYKWEVGTVYASREEFKDKGLSRQAALDEVQGTYWKQYKRIVDYCSELLRTNPWSSVTLKCSCRKWQPSGIPCTHAISCINFKGLDMDAYVDDCYKRPAYVKCYESVINPLNDPDLWEKTNFDDVMPPPYQKTSHRPVKKRKRGPAEAEDRSQSHLSKREQIQRCSNCGESGHKREGCKKPPLSAQPPKQSAVKRTNGGRKTSSATPITRSKASSQPTMQSATRGRKRSNRQPRSSSQPQPPTNSSRPNSFQPRSKPTERSARPNTLPTGTLHRKSKMKPIRSSTQHPPVPKENDASSSSQPARTVSLSHNIQLHVSPRKLRLMAKLPTRAWRKL